MSAGNDEDRVLIVGAGIVGLGCAHYLVKVGYRVTVIDRGSIAGACSHGNCGYVCPSHLLPLPAPGAVSSTLRGMIRPNSPFKIKPRMSPRLWNWLWHFMRRCNRRDMMEAGAARHVLLQSSMQLYEQLIGEHDIQCEWERRGLLFVFDSAREFEAYDETDSLLRDEFDVAATPYDSRQLQEPGPRGTGEAGERAVKWGHQSASFKSAKISATVSSRSRVLPRSQAAAKSFDESETSRLVRRRLKGGQSTNQPPSFGLAGWFRTRDKYAVARSACASWAKIIAIWAIPGSKKGIYPRQNPSNPACRYALALA